MTDAQQHRAGAVEEALARLDRIASVGAVLDGGFRVQAREALEALWDNGRVFGAWEPSEATEGATEPRGDTLGDELHAWWMQTAEAEAAQLVAKAVEYGGAHRAQDLIDIGRDLIAAGVKVPGPVIGVINGTEVRAHMEGALQELGIYFYLRGKVGRWTAALAEGRPVSDDTLYDIGIYVRMAQRIRAVGGWPV